MVIHGARKGFIKMSTSCLLLYKLRFRTGKKTCKRKILRPCLGKGPGFKVKNKILKDVEDVHNMLNSIQQGAVSTTQNEKRSNDMAIKAPKLLVEATSLRESAVNVLQPYSTKGLQLKTRAGKSVRESKEEEIETLELRQERNQPVGDELKSEGAITELPGIPLATASHNKGPGVIFVLEKASLNLALVGRKYQILNSNEHAAYMRKKNLNPYNCRPDIVHEALMEILDSRLCLARRVKAIYVKTDQGILIKVEPNTKIPRTLECFCNMMAELLQKFSIKAKGNHGKLLRLVENPVTKHLPANSLKIGLSSRSEKAVDFRDYAKGIRSNVDLVFVVGAMAHDEIDGDYADDLISVMDHPLTAGVCLRHIRVALERKWGIR